MIAAKQVSIGASISTVCSAQLSPISLLSRPRSAAPPARLPGPVRMPHRLGRQPYPGGAGGRAARFPRPGGPGPGERRCCVDGPDPLGAERPRPRRRGPRTSARALRRIPAAGHRHDHVGLRRCRSRPIRRFGTSRPRRRATSTPPAISIISGTQWPPMKGGSSHSSASTGGRGARDGPRTAPDGARDPHCSAGRPSGDPRRLAKALDVGEHLREVRGIERDHPRAWTAAWRPPRRRRRRRPRRLHRPPG